jgi:hypothetical protein
MVEVHRSTVEVGGMSYEAQASLNNCAGVWTSVLMRDGQIAGNGAGYSPDEAVRVAVERLSAKVAAGSR